MDAIHHRIRRAVRKTDDWQTMSTISVDGQERSAQPRWVMMEVVWCIARHVRGVFVSSKIYVR